MSNIANAEKCKEIPIKLPYHRESNNQPSPIRISLCWPLLGNQSNHNLHGFERIGKMPLSIMLAYYFNGFSLSTKLNVKSIFLCKTHLQLSFITNEHFFFPSKRASSCSRIWFNHFVPHKFDTKIHTIYCKIKNYYWQSNSVFQSSIRNGAVKKRLMARDTS